MMAAYDFQLSFPDKIKKMAVNLAYHYGFEIRYSEACKHKQMCLTKNRKVSKA